MPGDKYAANENVLTGSSDGNLYRQMIQPIILNLAKKKVKGVYSAPLALKAWENLVDRVVTDYRKKFGKYNDYIPYPLDAATKKLAAGGFMSTYREEFNETVAALKTQMEAKKKPAKKAARK
jgi:hypothetical protein